MAGNMAACGAGAGAGSYILVLKWGKTLSVAWAFEISKPIPSDMLIPPSPYLLILPKQIHQLETKLYETGGWGAHHFH